MTLPTAPADVVQRLRDLDEERERRSVLETYLQDHTNPDERGRFLVSLKDESQRLHAIDLHASLRLAESLLLASELAGRPDHHAFGLIAKGDALRYLGRFPESVVILDESAAAFRRLRDEVGWARTRIGWMWSLHQLGRASEAFRDVRKADAILVRHREWLRAAGLNLNVGAIHQEQGHYNRAMRFYDRALRHFEEAGRIQPEIAAIAELRACKVRQNQAEISSLRGDFPVALATLRSVRDVFARHGETVAVLRVDQYIANVYQGQGHHTRALGIHHNGLAAFERADAQVDAALVALSMVECYLSLNRLSEARDLAEDAVVRFERCGTPTETGKATFYLALAEARLENRERALHLLGEASRLFASTNLTTFLGLATLQRAKLQLDAGNWPGALSEAEDARALFSRRGLVLWAAQADMARARAALRLGRLGDAARLAGAALATTRRRDVYSFAHDAHHVLAQVARQRHQPRQALAECEAAITSIEHVQGRLATELRANFIDDKLPVYDEAIDLCLRLDRRAEAFAFLERAKSRALVDYLAGNPDIRIRSRIAGNQELLDELARLRDEHNWLYNRLYGYGFAQRDQAGDVAQDSIPDVEGRTLRATLRQREKRIASLLEQLTLDQGGGAEAIIAPRSDDHLAPPALDERTTLLEYYFRADAGGAFVATPERLSFVPLANRPADVGRLLNRWQLNLDATVEAMATGQPLEGLAQNARAILGALYRVLLQPLQDHLRGRDRLVVVPYGATHAVPFHALHDGQRFVIESHEVSVSPSSSLLRLCRDRARREANSALVVAHSHDGRLPRVLDEASAVAALVPGEYFVEEQATRAAVVAAAPRHGIVHLAAHGEARLDNPKFAHLKLADGQLTAADVFNLELDGALVTLSACETGRGVVTAGDELIGLSRGFLFAGVATLVQSLWRVDDGSTAGLMIDFYRALAAGRRKGDALRQAQLGMLTDRRLHPCFWAPFQLVGASD